METAFEPSPLLTDVASSSRARADRIIGQIKHIQWKHRQPLQYFAVLLELLGLPDVFDETSGGCAIWRGKTLYKILPSHCVKVADECIPFQSLDQDHCGFVYLCVSYDTSRCSCNEQLSTLSSHVIIDVEKGTIKARAHNIESCVAILSVFTGVGACRMQATKAKHLAAVDKAIKLATASPSDYYNLLCSLSENLQTATR